MKIVLMAAAILAASPAPASKQDIPTRLSLDEGSDADANAPSEHCGRATLDRIARTTAGGL